MERPQAARRRPFATTLFALTILLSASFAFGLVSDEAEAARAVSNPLLPFPILGATTVWTGEEFFIFGGRSGPEYQKTIIRYDPKTQEVAVMDGKLPSGRQSMAGVFVPGQRSVYLFGGATLVETWDPNKERNQLVPESIDDILRYDIDADKVTKIDQLPYTAWGLHATYNGRTIHVYGGLSFKFPAFIERKSDIVSVDPFATSAATRIKTLDVNLKYAVQDAAVAMLNGKAYLMGGLATIQTENGDETSDVVRTIQVFDTRIADAPTIAPFNLPVKGLQYAAGASGDGVLYAIGGRLFNGTALTSIFVVQPDQKVVTTHPLQLPGGRYAAGYAQAGEKGDIFLFGGRDANVHKDGLSDIIQFTPGVTEPSAPSKLETKVEGFEVVLRWNAPRYDGGSTVTGYEVYRVHNGFETRLGMTETTEYRDSAFPPGSSTTYRVRAVNSLGPSLSFAEATTKTPTRPPSAILEFDGYPANERVVLRWTAPADTGGAKLVNYTLYRTDPTGEKYAIALPTNRTEFVDTGLTNGESYTYGIQAFNAVGGSAQPAPVTVIPAPVPDAPRALTLEVMGGSVVLSWESALPFADEYDILRGTTATDLVRIASGITATTYEDIGVESGHRYHYAVVAKNNQGSSPPTAPRSAALLERPSEPRNVQALAGATSVRLQWTPPASLGGHSRVVYDVIREGPVGGPRTFYGIEATTFMDQDVEPGLAYTYRVVAVGGDVEMRGLESAAVKVVTVNKAPDARLTTDILTARTGDTVLLDASTSSDSDGRVTGYRFAFNHTRAKESKSWQTEWLTEAEYEYTFDSDGVYRISLTVKDDAGATSLVPSVVDIVVGVVDEDTGNLEPLNPDSTPGRTNELEKEGGFKTKEGAKQTPAPAGIFVVLALAAVAIALRRR